MTSSERFDLSRFALGDMIRCGATLRRMGEGAAGMEAVAERAVRYLHEGLVGADGEGRACALVRLFVTMPFAALDDDLQAFASQLYTAGDPPPEMKCLTLVATAGDEPAWNSRHTSSGHKALPLPSEESVARSPMIAQLIRQLGVDTGTLLKPDPHVVMDVEQHTFNVFYVGDALGSQYIPAQQEFVVPHGIRSVVGFGGLLPNGELFAAILFARVAIPRESADLFKTLALNLKMGLLPFVGRPVFA